MGRSWVIPLVIIGIMLLGVGFIGWQWSLGARRQATADTLEATFPALARAQVWTITRLGRCYTVAVAPASFSLFPDGTSCDPDAAPGTPVAASPPGLVEAIARLDGGPEVGVLRILRRTDEAVEGAEAEIGSCDLYVYEPGYADLPDPDSAYVVPIDADWYVIACDPPWLA